MSNKVPTYMAQQKIAQQGCVIASYSRQLAELRQIGQVDVSMYDDEMPGILTKHEVFEQDYTERSAGLAASKAFLAALGSERQRYMSHLAKAFRDLVAANGQSDRENFMIATLNNQNLLNGLSVVSTGAVDSVVVSMREVLKVAIVQGSSKIFIAHNHPSARTIRRKGKQEEHIGFEPSEHDIELTASLMFPCRALNIYLIDHMILGEIDTGNLGSIRKQRYFSFMESGLMDAIQYGYSRKRVGDVFREFAQAEKPGRDSFFRKVQVPAL